MSRSRAFATPFLRYNLLLVGLLCLGALGLAPSLWAWEPFDGSQTRVGGLSERDYGWNQPQEFFEERHYRVVETPDGYDRGYDIVVVGDSFSGLEFQNSWLDYLENDIGASILCLWSEKEEDLEQLLSSAVFREHPPRLFIYESVERQLIQRLSAMTSVPEGPPGELRPLSAPPLVMRPLDRPKRLRARTQSAPFLQKIQELAAAIKTRAGLRLEADRVRIVPLTTGALFSSRRRDELLVLGLDAPKLKLGAADFERARTGLRRLRRFVQGNGVTHFMLLPFPDKSSIYQPYMQAGADSTPNVIARLDERELVVRTDLLIEEELRRGSVDLFLPNDSHTSASGNRLVSRKLEQMLVEDGALK